MHYIFSRHVLSASLTHLTWVRAEKPDVIRNRHLSRSPDFAAVPVKICATSFVSRTPPRLRCTGYCQQYCTGSNCFAAFLIYIPNPVENINRYRSCTSYLRSFCRVLCISTSIIILFFVVIKSFTQSKE